MVSGGLPILDCTHYIPERVINEMGLGPYFTVPLPRNGVELHESTHPICYVFPRRSFDAVINKPRLVFSANVGIRGFLKLLDPRFRGDDASNDHYLPERVCIVCLKGCALFA